MSLVGIVLRNFGVTALGRGITYLVQLLVTMVLARIVAVESFGVIAVCSAVVALGQVLGSAGFGPALVQREAIEQRHVDAAMAITMILAGITSLLAWVSSPLVVGVFGIGQYLLVYQVVCLALPMGTLASVGMSLLQRSYRFRALAGIEVISYVFGFGLPGITIAVLGGDVWALAVAMVVQAMVKLVMVQIHAHRWCGLRLTGFSFSFGTVKELSAFSTGYSVGAVASFFSSQGDYLVVGQQFPASVVAHYTRAYQLIALPANLIGYALDSVLFPVLSRLQGEGHRLARAYIASVSLMGVVVMPVSVGIGLTSSWLVATIFGAGWESVVPILVVLSGFTFFRMAYKLTDAVTRAIGIVNQRAWLKIAYGIFVVAGAYLGSSFGILMVGLLVGVAVLMNYIAMNILVFRHLPWDGKGFVLAHARGMAVSAVVFVVLFGARGVLSETVKSEVAALVIAWCCLVLLVGVMLLALPRQLVGVDVFNLLYSAMPVRVQGSRIVLHLRLRMRHAEGFS